MNIIGKKKASFKDKDSGKEIEYGKLYVTYPDEYAEGLVCEAITVKPDMLRMVNVGDEVELSYNKYGKVDRVYSVPVI